MITEAQYDYMIKANSKGWINNVLKQYTKEDIMKYIDSRKYFNEVIKNFPLELYSD